MKVAIDLLVCCLAVTLAVNPEDVIDKYMDECKKELKVSSADDLRDPRNEGCFLACMYKKQGYMKADGTFDFETLISLNPNFVQPDEVTFRNFLERTNEKCTRTAKGDTCVLAKCFSDERYH